MKNRRRKSRRVRLAEAIRRDCDPVLFGQGFRNPNKTDLDRWGTTRRNAYFRWRGTDYDQIVLYWDKYNRSKVRVEFEISRVEHPPEGDRHCVRWVSGGYLLTSRYLGGCWFGPWRSPMGAAAFLKRRLQQLDVFLVRGEPHWLVTSGAPRRFCLDDHGDGLYRRMKIWGDPWLDPESDYALRNPAAQG